MIKRIIILSLWAMSNAFAQTPKILYCQGVSTIEGFKYVGIYCVDRVCQQRMQVIFDEYCPLTLDQMINPLDQQTIELGGRSGEIMGNSFRNIIEQLTREK